MEKLISLFDILLVEFSNYSPRLRTFYVEDEQHFWIEVHSSADNTTGFELLVKCRREHPEIFKDAEIKQYVSIVSIKE